MRFLVFQHIAAEHPGAWRDFMTADGTAWDVVELDRGEAIPESLDGYDALLVMGGPMDVWEEGRLPWLAREKQTIQHWISDRGAPFLGICLGHQLLADALGGTVGPMARPEVGISHVSLTEKGRRDRLFAGLGTRIPCLQWHGAEVKTLPPGALICADDASGAIQAFRFGDWAYGLQFHIEITATTVTEWAEIAAYRHSLEAAMGREGLARLDDAARTALPAIGAVARRIYAQFAAAARQYAAGRTGRTGRTVPPRPHVLAGGPRR